MAKQPKPNRCRFCGCTEERACLVTENGGTCSWFNSTKNVCTSTSCVQAEQSRVHVAVMATVCRVRKQEQWSEENLQAHTFLVAAYTLKMTGLTELTFFTRLPREVVQTFCERAASNGIFVGHEVPSYDYEGSRMSFEMDVLVLTGHMNRYTGGSEPTYSITEKGMRYAETNLLPQALAEATAEQAGE